MWIPSHLGLVGNELVDGGARYASLNGSIFDRPLSPCDFQSLARLVLLREWQKKWDSADSDRFAHSILPKVSLRPLFEGQKEERSFATSVSRIMSEHEIVDHLGQRDTDFLMHCPGWMCYMGFSGSVWSTKVECHRMLSRLPWKF
jgi:hypothetical protein